MKHFGLVLATLAALFVAKSFREKNREIRQLRSQIRELNEEQPQIYVDSCKRAVMMSCFYADCAVTPIEIMQEKICKIREEM